MPEITEERRRFDRIATDKAVSLRQGETLLSGTVLDISLRGLLLELQGDWQPEIGAPVKAEIHLDQQADTIAMDGEIAHIEGRHIGMRCVGLDLDSASRLRRMVELNLQDDRLLERNLAQLLSA